MKLQIMELVNLIFLYMCSTQHFGFQGDVAVPLSSSHLQSVANFLTGYPLA